jgi:hypothetical protein
VSLVGYGRGLGGDERSGAGINHIARAVELRASSFFSLDLPERPSSFPLLPLLELRAMFVILGLVH